MNPNDVALNTFKHSVGTMSARVQRLMVASNEFAAAYMAMSDARVVTITQIDAVEVAIRNLRKEAKTLSLVGPIDESIARLMALKKETTCS